VHYLVDGYNLAHWLVRDDSLHPDQLRERLLDAMHGRLPHDARKLDVYWDVRRPSPSIPPHIYLDWCTQHFVPDADEAIVDAVYAARNARKLCVVSRDREVTGKSRQLGSKVMAPAAFLRR
jgi:hypothetical protein